MNSKFCSPFLDLGWVGEPEIVATPNWALDESLNVESGYDTKVVAATTKCRVQIWMRFVIYIGDGAIWEDKLEVANIVRCPAREKGNTACFPSAIGLLVRDLNE